MIGMSYLQLKTEYEEFVKKAMELDPSPMWVPGERHSYVSKKAFAEANVSKVNSCVRRSVHLCWKIKELAC